VICEPAASIMKVLDPDPHSYISTACRVGDHQTCQSRPIVRCACPCYRGSPLWDRLDPGASPVRFQAWSWAPEDGLESTAG